MKNFRRSTILMSCLIIFAVMFYSCESNDPLIDEDFTGTYTGTITFNSIGRSVSEFHVNPAAVDISMHGDQIEVHCYSQNFDSIIILDFFHDGNDVRVCLTGDDFENMYGRPYHHDEMGNNMSHHSSEWMDHIENDHIGGEEHFGYFDMYSHTFHYTFHNDDGEFHFQGTKN